MHIAILTFDGFIELDSLIAYGMLKRMALRGDTNWCVSIASTSARVTSMNGLTIDAHIDLKEACTDSTSKPWVQAAGVNVMNQTFVAEGNIATAGGCLSAHYIFTWIINRLQGRQAAREVLHYFAPVGEKEVYLARALAHLGASSNEL